MLKLLISKDARKFLDVLPPKQLRQIVGQIFALLDNPNPHDSKMLKGYPFLRNDIGEHRIISDIHDGSLRVIVVGKRNDDEVYRQLKS